jgi:hypothetical protein
MAEQIATISANKGNDSLGFLEDSDKLSEHYFATASDNVACAQCCLAAR